MRRAAVLIFLVLVVAGCGGGSTKPKAPPPVVRAKPAINVVITATHRVKANAKWPVTIHVTDASGQPVSGTLTMNILLNGSPVGKVDNGKLWRFTGSWHEPKGQEITWPAQGKGLTFGFQAVVHVNGRTAKKTFAPVHVT
jgi:predicted component of type VI protein secretion system